MELGAWGSRPFDFGFWISDLKSTGLWPLAPGYWLSIAHSAESTAHFYSFLTKGTKGTVMQKVLKWMKLEETLLTRLGPGVCFIRLYESDYRSFII
jgi:hypothetical protein